MPFNGSGIYSLPAGNPVVTGTTISSTTQNSTMSDVASALSNAVCKDGQTTPSANLPMGGFRHTGVGDATARNQYCSAGQAQDNVFDWLTGVAGINTITATGPIGMAAYAAGQCFRFVAAGANTGAVTLNINSIGAKSITKYGATALAANDIPSGAVVEVVYDGTQFQLVGNGLSTYAPLSSPTFTGTVTLPGNASTALQAVPKQQLDSAIAGVTAGRLLRINVFNNSGTWTKQSDVGSIIVHVIGGGGGGGSNVGGGGGAGGYSMKFISAASLSASEPVTVGSGGSGGAGGTANDGASGGGSSFGAYLSATGGGGGAQSGGPGGLPGVGSGGDINLSGGGGGTGQVSGTYISGIGGNTIFGGGGRNTVTTASGDNGSVNTGGGGGGGGTSYGAGGNGGSGIVIVYVYA